MYKIIGADKKEYGPVSADQIHRWISEGRVNGQTLVQAAGDSSWKQLSSIAEFTEVLRVQNEPFNTPPPLSTTGQVNVPIGEILTRDYQLDIGSCVSRGWSVFKENMGVIMAAFLVWIVIVFAIQKIFTPLIQTLIPAQNVGGELALRYATLVILGLVAGPLIGGFYGCILATMRRQSGGVGIIFEGFKKAFFQLFLGYIVPILVTGLCLLPFTIRFEERLSPLINSLQVAPPSDMQKLLQFLQQMFSEISSAFMSNLLLYFICAIPVIYLSVSWHFTLPLIIDKNLSFGAAMGASWKKVGKHWWTVFGLTIVTGLINVLGFLCCCVGLLFTIPLGIVIMMCAYEVIFSQSDGQAH